MKPHKNWSFSPYKPLFFDTGDIYICRVAPTEDTISFDWLPLDDEKAQYTVYCRERDTGEFAVIKQTEECTCTISDLAYEHTYEFFVESNGKRSRVRLARCGESFGTTVNYLHPDDLCYNFSGRYLCSPSLVRHPDGYLLASMDVYQAGYPQDLTLIFRSDDDGKTWRYVSELFPCFWGKMFIHNGELYMISNSHEYEDILIGKSTDGGKTFTTPTVLMRGSGGRNGEAGCHRTPMPVVERDGRIWNTVEWGTWAQDYHAVMVLSAPVDSDLLDPDSWTFSEPVKYDPSWPGLPAGPSAGNMEGNLVEVNGKFCNVMRYDMSRLERNYGLIMAYEVDTAHPEAPLKFYKTIEFPANHSKFQFAYHESSKKYYTLASRITQPEYIDARNLLSLMASEDLEHWEVVQDVADKRDVEWTKCGFQYVDVMIEGDTLYFLCRTAINGAASFHDANYSSFGKIDLTQFA